MIGERHIREALDLTGCRLCQDGILLHENTGMHELPEPFAMMPCQKPKTQKESDQMTYERAVTEQELTEKAVAPRVTDADVEAFITTEHYFTAADGVVGAAIPAVRPQLEALSSPLNVMTICVLVLANGFSVHGISACADRNNFDPEIGRRIARANAKSHVWGHLGFELRTRLSLVEKATAPSQPGMTTHVGTKVIHAQPMTRGAYNELRGWTLPADENASDPGYLVEYADGGDANVAGFAGYVSWSPADVFDRAYGAPLK